jgi:hypothetical protein
MPKVKILWATPIGAPDYEEQLITEQSDKIAEASKWAKANGFDRLRVAAIDLDTPPDFTKTLQV